MLLRSDDRGNTPEQLFKDEELLVELPMYEPIGGQNLREDESQTSHRFLACGMCAILLHVGNCGEIPNGKERTLCPDHRCMRSSGAKTLNSMSCEVTENLSNGSGKETSKPSLAGWTSKARSPLSGEQVGSRSGKKAGEAAETTGMPIANRMDASARAILDHQPR